MIAAFADEMLVPLHQRIEMLRTPAHQHLKSLIGDQFLQITIDCAETYVRQLFTHPFVNLIGGRMRLIVPDNIPDNFELFGFSWLLIYLSHGYAVRSSTKDCRVSGSMTALAW